jgi:hypothetical protein
MLVKRLAVNSLRFVYRASNVVHRTSKAVHRTSNVVHLLTILYLPIDRKPHQCLARDFF